ncbi:MAG TPA: hypothetical protein VFT84_07955, partial [Gemmatimonadales bacterium]|nr:hypothetical protein [Gemmatimonadales bacterium]
GTPESRERRRPVVILCPSLFSIRNIVHSRMLPALRALGQPVCLLGSTPDCSPVTLPAPGPDQVYAELPASRPRSDWRRQAMDVVQRASFFRRHRLATNRATLWWYRREAGFVNRMQYAALASLGIPGSREPFYTWQMRYLQRLRRAAWDIGPARAQLEAIRPPLLVATSCIHQAEEPFLLAAQELGIPTLGCIQSFDHLTDRTLPADCDHYAVWNTRMQRQLLEYHRVRQPSQIYLTGTPQFDFHVRPEFRRSRAETLQELGLRPDDRYLLYAANTVAVTPTEPALVGQFARRVDAAPELRGHRIVVRLHPNDRFDRWDALAAAESRIVISRPSTKSDSFDGPEDQVRLVSTLLHADVCLNIWSSMSLDSVAVGTPVVSVAFAAERGSLEDRFCHMVYQTDWYRPIVESGGVRVVRDMYELVAETLGYVRDRTRDAGARARLAAQECGPLDGRSAERLAEVIANVALGGRPAVRAI